MEWYAQSERFIVLAKLASDHASEGRSQNTKAVKNFDSFEAVSVGVCHGFAIESLIKGLAVFHGVKNDKGKPLWGHNLAELLSYLNDIRNEVSAKYKGDFNRKLENISAAFENYRYPFESPNLPALDMDFTSYLAGELRTKLRADLGL